MIGKSIGIYIHVPFCAKKCPYCDFYSTSYKKNTADSYIDAVIRNINAYSNKELKVDTIYFGGGTPSLLSGNKYRQVIDEIKGNFDYSSDCEVTIEVNPSTVNEQKLCEYSEAGINRISVGVQSMIDSELKLLGRLHNSGKVKETLESAIKAGFKNFNIDIMHGLPFQTAQKALSDLRTAASLGCSHLSWYELTLEEDTYFGSHPPQLPDEDCLADIENQGFSLLSELGFNRYEVSGYTKDRRCQNNINYWFFYDYLGIGAGAHSKIKNGDKTCRRANRQDPKAYMEDVKQRKDNFFEVKKTDLPFEFMLNRLRVFDETEYDEFEFTTSLDFSAVKEKLYRARDEGLLKFSDTGYSLTEKGRWMLNDILELFL